MLKAHNDGHDTGRTVFGKLRRAKKFNDVERMKNLDYKKIISTLKEIGWTFVDIIDTDMYSKYAKILIFRKREDDDLIYLNLITLVMPNEITDDYFYRFEMEFSNNLTLCYECSDRADSLDMVGRVVTRGLAKAQKSANENR